MKIKERYERLMAMAKLRREGKTFRQIGIEFGVTGNTVHYLFKREFTAEELQSMRIEGKVVRIKPGIYRSPKKERNREIANRRQAGEAFDSIGKSYGLTRERIRQICKRLGAKPPEKPPEVPGKMVFHRWLKEAGYRRCYGTCKLWVPESQMSGLRCRVCNAAQQHSLWIKDHDGMLEKRRAWQRKNPDKLKATMRRYRDRYPEKVRERLRRAYHRRKANNPEKVRESARRSYQRLKAENPEKLREKWRRAALRRKEKQSAIA